MNNTGRIKRLAVCLLVLAGEYGLISGPLFSRHGMIQWPQILALAAAAGVLLSAGLSIRNLDLFSAAGYGCGFLAGLLFHQYGTDPGGGRTDNLWLIWTGVFLLFMILGLVLTVVPGSAGRKKE